jgi:hypothetical protein
VIPDHDRTRPYNRCLRSTGRAAWRVVRLSRHVCRVLVISSCVLRPICYCSFETQTKHDRHSYAEHFRRMDNRRVGCGPGLVGDGRGKYYCCEVRPTSFSPNTSPAAQFYAAIPLPPCHSFTQARPARPLTGKLVDLDEVAEGQVPPVDGPWPRVMRLI